LANPKGLTVELDEISQTLDLEELTGVDVSQDPELMREIAQATIDYMKKRITENNLGINYTKLKSPYSKSYQDSLEFKAADKSATDINITLSGETLDSFDILDEDGSTVKIGLNNEDVLPRAYGAMTGYEGHPTIPEGKYKRPFFGIGKKEFKEEILPKFKKDLANVEKKESSQDTLISKIRTAADFFVEE
jgi:hypothetical protein